MLDMSEDKVPQQAASRNLITHNTGKMSPQSCTKPVQMKYSIRLRMIYAVAFFFMLIVSVISLV